MGVAQRKITVRNNAVEAETLRSKLSNLVAWRKKAIVELEELRGKAQKSVEEHGRKEVRLERSMQNLRADFEATVETERRRVRMLESKWSEEHERLVSAETRVEESDKSIEREKAANKGEEILAFFQFHLCPRLLSTHFLLQVYSIITPSRP